MTMKLSDQQRRLWRALYATLRTEQIAEALESVQMDHGDWMAFVDAMKAETAPYKWRTVDPKRGLSEWEISGPQHVYICPSCSSVWLFREEPGFDLRCEACGVQLEEGEQ